MAKFEDGPAPFTLLDDEGRKALKKGDRVLVSGPAATFTLLDDEGRKALKKGDRVLVEAEIFRAELDEDGDICTLQDFAEDGPHQSYVKPKNIFALLPPAKKPAAVGDFVSILGATGSKGKVLAFASNGHAVVEYAAGDGINVAAYDLSCLELIS